MNEIIKSDGGVRVVKDPFSDEYFAAGDSTPLIASAQRQLAAWRAMFEHLGDVATAPIEGVKMMLDVLKAGSKTLLDYNTKIKDALFEASGYDAFQVQTTGKGHRIDPDSVRGKINEMIKVLEARIEAEKPKAPTHTYVLRLNCTDAALAKLCKEAVKAGATDVVVGTAQTDKAIKQITKWFDENA